MTDEELEHMIVTPVGKVEAECQRRLLLKEVHKLKKELAATPEDQEYRLRLAYYNTIVSVAVCCTAVLLAAIVAVLVLGWVFLINADYDHVIYG